jgi:hypothetical protein
MSRTAQSCAWSVHLPTAGETRVRLHLRPREPHDPWPLTLALTELAGHGVGKDGRFRSLGAGRGEPLLASQELTWRGLPLHLETTLGRDQSREVTLELPAWDELTANPEATEDDLWDLLDALAAAVDAHHGSIDDDLALLVPAAQAADPGPQRAAHYRDLPRSGLTVLLR